MDRYEVFGIFAGVAGLIVTFYGFYLLGNTILESGGIALLIIGFAFILTVPEAPSRSVSILAAETLRSFESFASKLAPGMKFVYEAQGDETVLAYASALKKTENSEPRDREENTSQDQKTIQQSGVIHQPITFTPIGSSLMANVKRGDDYQSTLKRILVEESALASGCDALRDPDGSLRIEIKEPVPPLLALESAAFEEEEGKKLAGLDSPLAQICASLLALCSGDKVIVKEESLQGKNKYVLLGFAEEV